MNTQKLKNFVEQYSELIKTNSQYFEDAKNRAERIEFYQSFYEKKLLGLTEEEFTEFIGKLWASSLYGNKKYLTDKMIASNQGFDNLKKKIAEFLFGSLDIVKRWDDCLKSMKYFGPASMSEILCYIYPDKFVIANSQVIKALEILECTDMPHYNYQFTGKVYEKVCTIVKEVAQVMVDNKVKCENLLAADYFLWEVAREIFVSKTIKPEPIPKTESASELVHDEILEKIVQIGITLGFDSKSEVKVAKGAIVDVVWSANIGNMGRVMYVFEVQSKGSIDSLILNLQKASNNKAVQAIVAVSDTKQLMKIRDEVEDIKNLEIKYWDYIDVITVYESLAKAHNLIGKLGLVPNDFILQ